MLRFTERPDGQLMERLPRDEVDLHGRRLRAGGVLQGALHTLGYVRRPLTPPSSTAPRPACPRPAQPHRVCGVLLAPSQYSTDVCLGSPGRRFDLIVDTGSSITAVPCSSCKQCGAHHCGIAGRFDMRGSSSATAIGCRTPPAGFACEKCSAAGQCTYSVHYTEGSAISGHIVTDVAHFMHSGGGGSGGGSGGGVTGAVRVSPKVFFGCQTQETGMFYRQEADGIMGMQPPRARQRVPSMLTSLVQQRAAAEVFSLCLSDRAGLFLLGGAYAAAPAPSSLSLRVGRGTLSARALGPCSRPVLSARALGPRPLSVLSARALGPCSRPTPSVCACRAAHVANGHLPRAAAASPVVAGRIARASRAAARWWCRWSGAHARGTL